MSLIEALFTLGNVVILPFWALMILAPGWSWTKRLMASFWPIIVVAAFYVLGLIVSLMSPAAEADLSQLTLDLSGLALLLGTPAGAAVAWLHMIALDLLAGRWAYLDSRDQRMPAWQVALALFFTLMAGPFGVLLYLGLRALNRRAAA